MVHHEASSSVDDVTAEIKIHRCQAAAASKKANAKKNGANRTANGCLANADRARGAAMNNRMRIHGKTIGLF